MKKKLGMALLWFAACVIMNLLFGLIAMLAMIGASFSWLQPALICYKRGESNGTAAFGAMFIVTCLAGIAIGAIFR